MIKINKTKARRLFNEGVKVYAVACKMRLESAWNEPCLLSRSTFEKAVNSFEYYNCCNERGKYSHFYIEEVT